MSADGSLRLFAGRFMVIHSRTSSVFFVPAFRSSLCIMSTTTYLFKLHGNDFDLSALAEQFRTGPPTVFRYPLDDGYYLSLELREGLHDLEALNIAEDTLAIMHGVALVSIKDFEMVRITGISRRDSTTGQML